MGVAVELVPPLAMASNPDQPKVQDLSAVRFMAVPELVMVTLVSEVKVRVLSALTASLVASA